MANVTRKYDSAHALNLPTTTVIMLPPDQLSHKGDIRPEIKKALDSCHIYIIASRPRVTIDRTSVFHLGDTVSGRLKWREEGDERRCNFSIKAIAPKGELFGVGDFPHRQLVSFRGGRIGGRFIPVHDLVHGSASVEPKLRDYEVQYVGQAYGDGDRSAFTRLKKHETLQRIQADFANERIDDELMLFLFEFADPMVISSINPFDRGRIQGDADAAHFADLVTAEYSDEEIVNLSEAALIRYFQPPYNKHLRANFPDRKQKILSGLYERDFDALTVELNTEDIGARLGRESPDTYGMHHIIRYDLHDPDVRRSFFQMRFGDGDELTKKDMNSVLF